MRDQSPVAQVLEVAASAAPLLERARDIVESLDRWLPVEAIWLALSDPDSNSYATVGSSGLERSVLDYLDRPSVAREIQLAELNVNQPPISVTELPVPMDDLPTWADCLIPAGFREGLGVPLFEPGGPYVGMLSLFFSSAESPSGVLRDRLQQLAPLIALGVSPMRSLLASARLVQAATAGAVLLCDGRTHPLPGLEDDPLLVANSGVVNLARHILSTGQVYRSFMWPTQDGPHSPGHVRMTVLAATDVPPFVLGTLLMTAEGDCRGLTARELEVLGLLVDGRSNQQIAEHLVISARTVATHVEHILHKLEVPTRTLAAVRAEREGCYVPAPRQPC
jgi:DNA-binding CsgD family transcriptional regulator